jgi:hypothetical protein
VYGLPFQPTNPGSDGGIELLNSLMKVDRNYPHPFRPDERGEDGQFKFGYSRFFLVVEDDAIDPPPANANPKSLHDSARARYQLKRWRELPVKDTPTGEIERGPEKRNDDFGNGLMFCVHDGLPQAVSLSYGEKMRAVAPVIQTLEEKSQEEPLTEAEQLQYHVTKEEVRRILRASSAVQEFDENLNPVNEDWR